MNLIEATDSTYKDEIKEGLVLLDFWAPWCVPCKMMNPILENLSEKIKVVKINADSNVDSVAEYGVRGLPTISLLKDGVEVKRSVGSKSEKDLLEHFAEFLDQ